MYSILSLLNLTILTNLECQNHVDHEIDVTMSCAKLPNGSRESNLFIIVCIQIQRIYFKQLKFYDSDSYN